MLCTKYYLGLAVKSPSVVAALKCKASVWILSSFLRFEYVCWVYSNAGILDSSVVVVVLLLLMMINDSLCFNTYCTTS